MRKERQLSTLIEPATQYAVKQVLHLYDHYIDNAEWSHLDKILTDDFELLGESDRFEGSAGARRYEERAGEHLPAHHVLNTFLERADSEDTIRAWSRYLLVTWDYSARVGDYLDLLRLTDGEWRLQQRRILPRGAGGTANSAHASYESWRMLGSGHIQ
jgi:hypothetical protein